MIMTRYTKKHFFRLFEIFIFYPCIAFLCSILGVFGYFLAVNELGYRSQSRRTISIRHFPVFKFLKEFGHYIRKSSLI